MFVLKLAVETAVLPALVCGVLFWMLDRLLRRKPGDPSFAGAISLGTGYLTGHVLSVGLPGFPPVGTTQWLFFLVVLAMIVSLLGRRRHLGHIGWLAFLIAAFLGFTLKPMFQYHWDLGTGLLWSVALFVGLLFLWRSMVVLREREGSTQLLLLSFLLTALLTSVSLGLSATTFLAQLAGTATACLVVLLLISLVRPQLVRGWVLVASMILTGLVLNGHFYAQLTGWNAASLLTALFAAWLGQLPWVKARPAWVGVVVVVLAVLLVTAPALVSSTQTFLDAPSIDDY